MYTRARKHAGWQLQTQLLPLALLDAVSYVILSAALRPFTAGSICERCERAGRVLGNKSVSLSPRPPPAVHQISSKSRSAAPCCEQTRQLHFCGDNGSKSWDKQALSHTKTPFRKHGTGAYL